MNRFKNYKPMRLDNFLRIGVYRGSDSKKLGSKKIDEKQSNTLHFDDLIVSDSLDKVNAALSD